MIYLWAISEVESEIILESSHHFIWKIVNFHSFENISTQKHKRN